MRERRLASAITSIRSAVTSECPSAMAALTVGAIHSAGIESLCRHDIAVRSFTPTAAANLATVAH